MKQDGYNIIYEHEKDIAKVLNNKHIVTNYVYLDNQVSAGQLYWEPNDTIPKVYPNMANSTSEIKNVVAMRLTSCTIAVRSQYTYDLLTRKLLSIGINELKSQSLISGSNTNFHFMAARKNWHIFPCIVLSFSPYEFNGGMYFFRTPITKIDSISINLFTPVEKLNIDSEYVSGYIGTTTFGPDTITCLFMDIDPFLGGESSGDTFTISQFTTDTPIVDAALIASINSTFTAGIDYAFPFANHSIVWLRNIDIQGITSISNPTIQMYRKVPITFTIELFSDHSLLS